MAATGVTFQVYTISASGIESPSTTLPAVLSKDIATGTQAVKIAMAIPGRRQYYFPKGDEGPTAKINCRLYGSGIPGKSDQHTLWAHTDKITGVFANSLIKVVASEYAEFPVGSAWWVDNKTIKRSGGYYNIWEMELGLTRSYRTVQDVERGV